MKSLGGAIGLLFLVFAVLPLPELSVMCRLMRARSSKHEGKMCCECRCANKSPCARAAAGGAVFGAGSALTSPGGAACPLRSLLAAAQSPTAVQSSGESDRLQCAIISVVCTYATPQIHHSVLPFASPSPPAKPDLEILQRNLRI